jgi:hypothetical protein
MNVLFLSPYFPPNAQHFCRALARRGVRVLAVGDVALTNAALHSSAGIADYVFEPAMGDYGALRAVVAGLVERHGRIDRLDSNGEHWLEAEGRLRDDFSVPGLGHLETCALRSKLHMGKLFVQAGLDYPKTVPLTSHDDVRQLAREHGFPLVFKPNAGSGAVDTFVVKTPAELEAALAEGLTDHVAQPFIVGDIVTFDGLTDASGQIVFCTSHVYDAGIMQVRQGALDGHYYSLRSIPPELERLGRRAVAAFEIRERFFHAEFFARPDGTYVALEMNVRPPGGFTTDMMGAACDFDVYDLWAAVLAGAKLTDFRYSRHFFTAHAGRRSSRQYMVNDDQLARELGHILFSVQPVPQAFAATMGNVAYLLRSPDLAALRGAIALVQTLK